MAQSRSKLASFSRPAQYISVLRKARFVAHAWLGAELEKDQVFGGLYSLDDLGGQSLTIRAPTSGTIASVASTCIVDPDDPVVVVAEAITM